MDGAGQSLISYRLRSVRVGVVATFLVLAMLLAFALIPSGIDFEDKTLYFALLGVAAAGAGVVALLPWTGLFARGWGMWAMYLWSVFDIALITAIIAITGGDDSPLHLLFALTTVFFSASYPPRAQVVLLLLTFGCYFLAIRMSEEHFVAATFVMRFGVLAALTYISSFLSRELIDQNVELESSSRRHAAAEERLGQSEADLAEAQEVACLGSWSWDIQRNRITWSDQLFRIYGIAPEEFTGDFETLVLAVHEDDRGLVRAAMERALDEASGFNLEYRIVRPDGEVRAIQSKGRVEKTREGSLRMLGTALDITDRKKAERTEREIHDLRMRQQQAVEINDFVVQGLAVASYALDAGDEARARAAIGKTLAAARSIVNQLLDVDALQPGDLVRSRSATVLADPERGGSPPDN